MYIRHKNVKGRIYAFEIESYRQGDKVRHRTKSLGFVCMAEDWAKLHPTRVGTTKNTPKIGSKLEADLFIGGKVRRIPVRVVRGTTQAEGKDGSIVRVSYDRPGRVTLRYCWNGQQFETETSLAVLVA
jgi:hypothetical protein